MQPFFTTTIGLALRVFQDNVERQDSVMHKNPNDFVLYQIGEFDEHTGEVINKEQNINLGMAIDFHPNGKLEPV